MMVATRAGEAGGVSNLRSGRSTLDTVRERSKQKTARNAVEAAGVPNAGAVLRLAIQLSRRTSRYGSSVGRTEMQSCCECRDKQLKPEAW
jgi:hypothetical protein